MLSRRLLTARQLQSVQQIAVSISGPNRAVVTAQRPQHQLQLCSYNAVHAEVNPSGGSDCSRLKAVDKESTTRDYISQIRWKTGKTTSMELKEKINVPNTSSVDVRNVNCSLYKNIHKSQYDETLCIKGPGILGVSGLRFPSSRLTSSHLCCNYNLNNFIEKHTNSVEVKTYLPLADFYANISNTCSYSSSIASKRFYHTTRTLFDSEPSSQVEISVNALKEKAEASKQVKIAQTAADDAKEALTKAIPSTKTFATTASTPVDTTAEAAVAAPQEKTAVVKKSIWIRLKEEAIHYYHGFRLLFVDTKICVKYCYIVLNGEKLSRREYRQLVRTTGDLFRLVPFSVFVIIPFMELLLPVAIKLFPGMLPSTFETANEKEAKIKKQLKVKLEMAKFLQQTLDSMSLEAKGHKSEGAKEFVEFFEKVRRTGEHVSNEEILKFSKLFADSITLDSLSRPQLMAICRLLEMRMSFGTNISLRFLIRMKLRSLAADDKLIASEGVASLAPLELQQACRKRGMRAYGMTHERLRTQLQQWLELSLDKKVPPSLLLLSRTLYMSDNVDPNVTLAATISQLPEEVKTRTKAAIGMREGKIDNRTRFEVIKSEEKKIEEDNKDMEVEMTKKIVEEIKKKETRWKDAYVETVDIGLAEVVAVGGPTQPVTAEAVIAQAVKITKATVTTEGEIKEDTELLVDKAPVLEDKAAMLITDLQEHKEKAEELSSEDLAEVEEALETMGAKQRRMILEEQELTELKTEMQDYKEDIEDLKQVIGEVPENSDLRESKAAKRLFTRVSRLIEQAEPVIAELNAKTEEMQRIVDAGDATKQHKDTLVDLEDLVTHLRQVADAPDSTKLSVIKDVLTSMDTDHDGAIKLEHIMKALELLSEDQVGVPRKLFEDVIQAMAKEEELEAKAVIQTALAASKRAELAAKPPAKSGSAIAEQ